MAVGIQIENAVSTSTLALENIIFREHNIYWGSKYPKPKPPVALYINGNANLNFSNVRFENNTYDIYWPDGGDECAALASSTDWNIECSAGLW